MLGTETRLSLGRCTVFELKFLIKGINMIFKNYILLNPKEVYARRTGFSWLYLCPQFQHTAQTEARNSKTKT